MKKITNIIMDVPSEWKLKERKRKKKKRNRKTRK
jgi:hypothetical protein